MKKKISMNTPDDGNSLKVLVCGGIHFNDYSLLEKSLNDILKDYSNIEIVSGHAKGADSLGEEYATNHHLKLKIFPAEWTKYGKRAGPIRNSAMIDYIKDSSSIVVAFWDGQSKGTKDTINKADKNNINVYIIRYDSDNKESTGGK